MTTPIAILASGRGSNFDAIAQAIQSGALDAKISCVVSDRADAPVLQKAKALQIPALHLPPPSVKEFADLNERRKAHETRVIEAVSKHSPRFLVLAGYMRIVTPHLIEAFRSERGYSRIVNIHPSLLPAFPGINAYAQAFHYGSSWTGVTVHLVELDVDSGPICAQEPFKISDCSSVDEVERRGLAIEHRLYPQTLKWVLPEKFSLEYRTEEKQLRRLCVRPN